MKANRVIIWVFTWIVIFACTGAGQFPEIEIIYPPGDQFECDSSTIPVSGRVNWCIDCSITISGETAPVQNDGSFRQFVKLQPGPNKIEIKLRDRGGSVINKSIHVTRVSDDRTPRTPQPSTSAEPDSFRLGVPEMPVPVIRMEAPAPASGYAIHATTHEKEIRPIQKRIPEKAASNKKTIVKTQFLINGKSVSGGVEKHTVIDDRSFVKTQSLVLAAAGVTLGPAGKSLIFSPGLPFKDNIVFLDETISPAPFEENGDSYMPLRAVFEKAGWTVYWEPGRIYLNTPCFKSFVEFHVPESDRRRVETVVYRDVMFARAEDMINIRNINIEALGPAGVKITGENGRWINISRSEHHSENNEMIVMIIGGNSPPVSFKAPGKIITESEYLIPVRAVFGMLGYEITWEQFAKSAEASSEITVSGIFQHD